MTCVYGTLEDPEFPWRGCIYIYASTQTHACNIYFDLCWGPAKGNQPPGKRKGTEYILLYRQ